jgi:hypothetical protein
MRPSCRNSQSQRSIPTRRIRWLGVWTAGNAKLLDLSARNPLLNQRTGKTSLPFVCDEPGALEDALASGARISIAPFPRFKTQNQDAEIYQQRTGEDLKKEYSRDALSKKQLLVDLAQEELDKRAVEIYRKAQTSLREGGSNTLFLAIGFLLWKQNGKDDRHYRAPLILLPVSLERKSVRSGIKMMSGDDEPRFNTTLLELLKKDFGIEIKGLHGSLPQDHSGVDVDGVWNQVRQAIKSVPGFEVIEDNEQGNVPTAFASRGWQGVEAEPLSEEGLITSYTRADLAAFDISPDDFLSADV